MKCAHYAAITFCITVCLNGRGTVEHGTVGLQVTLAASNVILDETMTRFDVPHTYEPAMATIRNKVPERFEGNVLPFFSKNLSSAPVKR